MELNQKQAEQLQELLFKFYAEEYEKECTIMETNHKIDAFFGDICEDIESYLEEIKSVEETQEE